MACSDIKDEAGNIIAHRRRTPDELIDVMNAAVQIPGLNNAWTMPIKTRIDMLATGIKPPLALDRRPTSRSWSASLRRSGGC